MSLEHESEDFALDIVDVFELTGRGIVVMGPIRSGTLRTGETVEVWDGQLLVMRAEAGVELVCSRSADPATIGLRLGSVNGALLAPGQVVKKHRGTS